MLKVYSVIIWILAIIALLLLGMAVNAVSGGVYVYDNCDTFNAFYLDNKLIICLESMI